MPEAAILEPRLAIVACLAQRLMVLGISEQHGVALVWAYVVRDDCKAQAAQALAPYTIRVRGKPALAVLAPCPVVEGLPFLTLGCALVSLLELYGSPPATRWAVDWWTCWHSGRAPWLLRPAQPPTVGCVQPAGDRLHAGGSRRATCVRPSIARHLRGGWSGRVAAALFP